MEKSIEKNALFLVFAGVVLILANMAVVMGVRNGQIAPLDNFTLWGAFSVLNICSLLWAVSLLGLQPLVVAVSYVAGGLLAFHGVRMAPDVNVAEIATAGATYSAFGALLVGNATAKVRLVFFARRQVPFVFIILSLLVVDGLLNSRISQPDWHIISTAVVYPFLFSGVLVGLVWMLVARIAAEKPTFSRTSAEALAEQAVDGADAIEDDEAAQLMISIPENVIEEEQEELEEELTVVEPAAELSVETILPETAEDEAETVEEDESLPDTFFPLEIDSAEEIQLEDNPELLGVAAMVADHAAEPELDLDEDLVDLAATTISVVEEEPAEEEVISAEPVDEPVEADVEEEGKAETGDWLDSHLDLLNKLK